MAVRVLISGGGLAGMTLAWWLHRDERFEPIIIEQAPSLRRQGYMIDFFGTGWDVAERMGLTEAILEAHQDIPKLVIKSGEGEDAASVSIEAVRAAMDYREANLMHDQLEEIFYDAIENDVEVRFGQSIASLAQSQDRVDVRFEDGREESFDFVVGADGIHSNVRRLLFGEESNFSRYLGYQVAAVKMSSTGLPISENCDIYQEPGRQAAVYPFGSDGVVVTFIYASDEDVGYVPRDRRLAHLREVFDGAGWIVPQLLEAIDEDADIFHDSVTQIEVPRWSDRRVVLVGDACQCMTLISGQGASMALGSAFTLAREWSRYDDHEAAFAAYACRMRPHIEERQEGARDFASSFVPGSQFRLSVQNVFVKLLFRDALAGLAAGSKLAKSMLGTPSFERLPRSAGDCLGYRIHGTLRDVDYRSFAIDAEKRIAEHGHVRLLLDLGDLKDVDLKVLWRDMVFGLEHASQIDRLAIMGKSTRGDLLVGLVDRVAPCPISYFEREREDEAWEWLRAKPS